MSTSQQFILTLPGRPAAMLDSTVAELFGVIAKRVNEARNRNPDRFPADFYFQLTQQEVEQLRSQAATFNENNTLRDRLTQLWDSWSRYAPHAYTEEGVAMLAGILTTPQAVAASVRALRLFRETRERLAQVQAALALPGVRPGQVEELRLARAQAELLRAKPYWRDIAHYAGLGLSTTEISRLVGRSRSTLRLDLAAMVACGLLPPRAEHPVATQLRLARSRKQAQAQVAATL